MVKENLKNVYLKKIFAYTYRKIKFPFSILKTNLIILRTKNFHRNFFQTITTNQYLKN